MEAAAVLHHGDHRSNLAGVRSEPAQMRAVLESNPQLNHVLSDPDLMRQTLDAMRNPGQMAESRKLPWGERAVSGGCSGGLLDG